MIGCLIKSHPKNVPFAQLAGQGWLAVFVTHESAPAAVDAFLVSMPGSVTPSALCSMQPCVGFVPRN